MKTLARLCLTAALALALLPAANAKPASPHHTAAAHAKGSHQAAKPSAHAGARAGAHAAKKGTHRKSPRRVASAAH